VSTHTPERPCAGLSVVEIAVGVSDLGLGMAGGVPGQMLAELGATVVRLVAPERPAIDQDVAWGRVWHRDKRIVASDDREVARTLLVHADVALVYGSEAVVEGRGLGYRDLAATNPSLVYARCRPSRTSRGPIGDFGLLVEAREGLCTQLEGHRPGPIFLDARASSSGTALLLAVSALGLLGRRALTGSGGWAETSLYDGMLTTLGTMIGRSERAAPEVESYWAKGSTFPNFMYPCADGELIQIWFGGKGMYAALLDVLGDEPSEAGYYADQVKGLLNERARRWSAVIATQSRAHWIARLREVGIPCEPVLSPGEALDDPHLVEIGLAISRAEGPHHDVVLASPISVQPMESTGPDGVADDRSDPADPAIGAGRRAGDGAVRLGVPGSESILEGVRVLDFSAFVAGPLAAQILADMGADVIKVEPLEGEAMRAAAYAVAACQRGKRSLALDLHAAEARPVVERLIRWADVVLHNFRVGVSERLGIDEQTVARLNPRAVYCHASAFGASGPRAGFPGNDALMQALTGLERGVGGAGNPPLAPTWIPIDMAGGWVTASAILAGLFGRASSGRARPVATSLLGAGMLLQSGVYQRDGRVVSQPELDAQQTGYGPGYRLYRAGDDQWLALVVPDGASWRQLCELLGTASLSGTYAPLRGGANDEAARRAEHTFEEVFATAPAADWAERLRHSGVLVELIEPMDRDRFRQGVLDDPINRQLGRVVAFETAEWGHFEQIGCLVRCGPGLRHVPPRMFPGVGGHSAEVLGELGFSGDEIDVLLGAKVVRQL
jgi:crotonobetainyl-CoA:carnitine CoA-transferase CaiB-like acyl-CoA transferase